MAARQPARVVAVVVIVLLALSGVMALAPPEWETGSKLLLMFLAAVLLVGAIAEFLFPVTYTLDTAGAHARFPGSHRLLPWTQVRRVYLRRNGIKLSPLAVEGWAENYRGVFLRTGQHDSVLDAVRAWLDAAGMTPEVIEER